MNIRIKAANLIILSLTLSLLTFASILPAFAFQNNFTSRNFFSPAPAQAPAFVVPLLGRYENIRDTKETFLIFEDAGALKMLYREKYYPLTKKDDLNYFFVDGCRDAGNSVKFIEPIEKGRFHCMLNGILYRLITYGGDGGVYKIKPLRPIDELKKAAFSAKPPREQELTLECELFDLRGIGGNLKFDIRYATKNNFMGECFYETPGAYMQKPAAYALLYVAKSLARHGLAMIVYDAYRPWYVTKMFYDATPDEQKNFVADPSKGSRHNRGTAVDVGLYNIGTGELIDMGSGYDEFSERALPGFAGSTSNARWHRKILEYYMNKAGFTVFDDEWWHFDYRLDAVKYPIQNITFELIETKK
ncbi:MAG TPA: M15 family metallopeptidase [Candidatus Wallbacteria bacterium]|nr:M15 family metallopeptidase [Candidatus Wallbacteria bacterium]